MFCYYGTNINTHIRIFFYFFKYYTPMQTKCFTQACWLQPSESCFRCFFCYPIHWPFTIGIKVLKTRTLTRPRQLESPQWTQLFTPSFSIGLHGNPLTECKNTLFTLSYCTQRTACRVLEHLLPEDASPLPTKTANQHQSHPQFWLCNKTICGISGNLNSHWLCRPQC